ncbi:MAG TPA: transcription initiation factor IIB family protein [Thermoplasmata archaeon]|nr:transcription initiation factor IIB family protein [Thermoplasmata archaeon]
MDRTERCAECHGTLFFDGYEFTCSHCGLVDQIQTLDECPIFRTDDKGRTQNPGHGPGLGSTFWLGWDAKGKRIADPRTQFRLCRMRRQQRRAVQEKTHSADEVRRAVHGLAARLEMPRNVTDRALHIALSARKEGVVRGISFVVIAGASLGLASKIMGFPRPVDEIIAAMPATSHVKARTMTARRKIARGLGLALPVIDPAALIPRYLSKLGLDPAMGIEVREALGEMGQTAGSAYVTLAIAIYVACCRLDERRSEVEVSSALGVSEGSIRSRLRHYFPALPSHRGRIRVRPQLVFVPHRPR